MLATGNSSCSTLFICLLLSQLISFLSRVVKCPIVPASSNFDLMFAGYSVQTCGSC